MGWISFVCFIVIEILIKNDLMGIVKNNKIISYPSRYGYIDAVRVISLIFLMKTDLYSNNYKITEKIIFKSQPHYNHIITWEHATPIVILSYSSTIIKIRHESINSPKTISYH